MGGAEAAPGVPLGRLRSGRQDGVSERAGLSAPRPRPLSGIAGLSSVPPGRGCAQSRSAELLALGVVDGDRSAVILSSFSPQPSDVTRPVIVDLPSGVLAGAAPMKSIR